jgi:hypothetical protein
MRSGVREKMKVWVDRDEKWPDFRIWSTRHFGSVETEVSEEDYDEFRKTEKEYEKWQKRLKKLWEAALSKSNSR